MTVDRLMLFEPRDLWWEASGLASPAVFQIDNRTYLIYQTIGADSINRIGLAVSDDGQSFERLPLPFLESDPRNPDERLGFIRPRVSQVDHLRELVLTVTALSIKPFPQTTDPEIVPWKHQLLTYTLRSPQQFRRQGEIESDLDSSDGVFFPNEIQNRYWLIHHVNNAIYLSSSTNFRHWNGAIQIAQPQESWESTEIVAAGQPILTEQGWLLLYNGRAKNRGYEVGAMLLDRYNPALVRYRASRPILSAESAWEKRGGTGLNGLFASSVILRHHQLWIYYGAVNRVIGLAKIALPDILARLNGTNS